MEENFPRGGVVKSSSKSSRKRNKEADDLFLDPDADYEWDKRGNIKKTKKTTKYEENKPLNIVEKLTENLVLEDMLILGRIKKINEYSLDVGLPNNIRAEISITDICPAYTEALKSMAENDDEGKEAASLEELFTVGQLLYCKVKSIESKGKNQKKIHLTINPSAINANVQVKKFTIDTTIQGCIATVEDHGYTVDLGIPGYRAFVNDKDAGQFIKKINNGNPLLVGMPVPCCMVRAKLAAVKSGSIQNLIPVHLNNSGSTLISVEKDVPKGNLVPGTVVMGKVTSTQEHGIFVEFLDKYHGAIHVHHLPTDLSKYSADLSVKMCVLYHQPHSEMSMLSALPHLTNSDSARKAHYKRYKIGDIVRGTTLKTYPKSGVLLRLPGHVNGWIPQKFLEYDKERKTAEAFDGCPDVRCRVMDYDFMNNVAVVTTGNEMLERTIIELDDCKPGQLVKCKIFRFTDRGGIKVQADGFMKGFIPSIHNSNVPLKQPEKRYAKDQEIDCRVLKVEKENQRLVLTAKPALVNSELPVMSSYDDLQENLVTDCCVVKTLTGGVLVTFYGDLRGFCPKHEVGVAAVNDLDGMFYVGQVVKCRITAWDESRQRISVSFKLDGQTSLGAKRMEKQAQLDITKLHRGVVRKVSDDSLLVKVDHVTGVVPMMHLSDNVINCRHLLKTYERDDVIEELVLFERKTTPIFSMKKTLIEAVRERPLVTSIDDLLEGTTVAGVVENKASFGLFVMLNDGIKGLVTNKLVCDHYTPHPGDLYSPGQTVMATVKDVDPARKRIGLSLRMSDSYHGNTQPALDQLENYLTERERIVQHCRQHGDDKLKRLLEYQFSAVLDVDIDGVNEFGCLGHVTGTEVKVICTVYHMSGSTVQAGETRRAAVLYVDLDNQCLEVTLAKKTVSRIARSTPVDNELIKPGQVIKAEVLLVKPEFCLVSLAGHAESKLAFTPSERSLNDVTGWRTFEPGFTDKVVVKTCKNGAILCSWQVNERPGPIESAPKHVEYHDLKVGAKVNVVVKDVLPWQLNVRVGAVPGRIHVTELEVRDCKPGQVLTSKYRRGQEMAAVVIGFRDAKTYQPSHIIHAGKHKLLPELSVLTRRLSGDLEKAEFAVGDSVAAFYSNSSTHAHWFSISATVNAHSARSGNGEYRKGAYLPATITRMTDDNIYVDIDAGTETEMVETEEEVDLDRGIVVSAVVKAVNPRDVVVQFPGGKRGKVVLTELADEYTDDMTSQFECGQSVRCKPMRLLDTGRYLVSLRQSRVAPVDSPKPRDRVIEKPQDLFRAEIIRGFVHVASKTSVSVLLGIDVYGRARRPNISDDSSINVKAVFTSGRVVYAKVLKVKGGKITLSLKGSDTGKDEIVEQKIKTRDRKRKLSDSETPSKRKRSRDSSSGPGTDRKMTQSQSSEISNSSLNSPENQRFSRRPRYISDSSVTSEGSQQLNESETASKNAIKPKLSDNILTPIDNESESEDSDYDGSGDEEISAASKRQRKSDQQKQDDDVSSSDDEVAPSIFTFADEIEAPVDGSKAPRLKLNQGFTWIPDQSQNDMNASSDEDDDVNISHNKLDKHAEEKLLCELENRLLDNNHQPETEEEFERLVVQSPDSSLVWVQYMTYFLKLAEIERARTVAERGLSTISFREEQEKLNVWVALMNLENLYGTSDQLTTVVERATKTNDAFKVKIQLVKIYENSDKTESAEKLYFNLARSHGYKKEVWVAFGQFYYKLGKFQSARKTLEKALKTLDKRDHMEVVTKFGRMEFEHGQTENGIDLFERILAECPKRIDVWSVYIDLLIKFHMQQKARKIFRKVTGMKIPIKKLKAMFKKWLEFENKFGTEDTINEVKEKVTLKAKTLD